MGKYYLKSYTFCLNIFEFSQFRLCGKYPKSLWSFCCDWL